MIGVFYGQTEYNYLENSIPLELYVEIASKYNYKFLTITDKNMHGYYKFYNLCSKHDIKPIIGLEITLESEHSKTNNILVYAKNDLGMSELFKLSKIQEINKIVKKSELDICNNLIVVTCDNSLINEMIEMKNEEYKIELMSFLQSNNEFYIGVNNNTLLEFCIENNLKFLPISQTSFVNIEDFKVYETLKKIGGSKDVKKIVAHIKTIDELSSEFNVDAFKFVGDIYSLVSYSNINDNVKLPVFDKNISNSKLFLEELATKGLQKRLKINNKENLFDDYLVRLKFELKVINEMGFNDYFLIVWDFIKFSKKNDILVGPGRGSAAGSLTSYCLGITEIDPLQYNLLFERFLNIDRISLPDIDIDFPDNKREKVIQYVKDKYGENHVCYISAFNTFGVKSSIRDICKVNNINIEHANLMLQYIDKYGLEEALEKYKSREELIEVFEIATKISGLIRHTSTHAAGIILSDNILEKNIPLKNGINGIFQSQLESVDLEKKGYLKIDFLGIRNLTLIDKILKLIPDLNLSKIPLNDKKTFDLLSNGDTNGVFQLESTGIKNVLRKLKPTSFNDIVSVLALYRPGPMDNIDLFINRKKSNKIEYQSPELEPILKETYGVIVYQEQIMQIANVISNYNYSEADILRRAVSKKDKNILDENRRVFVSKAINNNKSEKLANEIYDLIVKFADYGFNKSHSVAYARLSYEMAYLKANFTKEYVAVMLDNSIGDHKEMISYINYAKEKGINILMPKINHSQLETIIIKDKILLPLNAINKIGINVSNMIIEERHKGEYKNFDDFKERTTFLNDGIISNLVHASVFDEFKLSKKSMLEKNVIDPIFARHNTDLITNTEEYDFTVLKENELIALGFNFYYDLFKKYENEIKKIKCITNTEDIKENSNILVVAHILNIKETKTKNNELMSFVDLDLNFTNISAVVFPKNYTKFLEIDKSLLVLLKVVVQKRNEELQLVINDIKKL